MRKSKNSLGVPMGSHQSWRHPKDQKVVAHEKTPRHTATFHHLCRQGGPASKSLTNFGDVSGSTRSTFESTFGRPGFLSLEMFQYEIQKVVDWLGFPC